MKERDVKKLEAIVEPLSHMAAAAWNKQPEKEKGLADYDKAYLTELATQLRAFADMLETRPRDVIAFAFHTFFIRDETEDGANLAIEGGVSGSTSGLATLYAAKGYEMQNVFDEMVEDIPKLIVESLLKA